MRTQALVVTMLFLVVVPALGLLLPEDDAGTGGDASGDRSFPTSLPSFGAFAGNLTLPGDADWYAPPGGFTGDGPFCVEAYAAGALFANVTLAVDAAFARHEVQRALTPAAAASDALPLQAPTAVARVRLGIALPPIRGSLFGVESAGAAGAAGGPYEFTTDALMGDDFGPGDGSLGEDAPGTILAAPALPRACTAGELNGTGGDERDVFSFPGELGERVTVTWLTGGSPAATLHILDPLGETVAIVENSTSLTLVLDQPGPWYVAPTTTGNAGGGWWAMGFTDDPGHGCRPLCAPESS